jgi:hypothetical protein
MNKKKSIVSTSGAALMITLPLLLISRLPAGDLAGDRPDVLIADFESESYGEGWKTTGTAFGKGPAKGTLPNQMPVSGSWPNQQSFEQVRQHVCQRPAVAHFWTG